MTKEQLQEQIDELKKSINELQPDVIYGGDFDSAGKDLRLTKRKWGGDRILDTTELRKQFLALLDYLKIKYVEEDKHTEGFKKYDKRTI